MRKYIKAWAIGMIPIGGLFGFVILASVWTPFVILAPLAAVVLIWVPYMIGDDELYFRERKKQK